MVELTEVQTSMADSISQKLWVYLNTVEFGKLGGGVSLRLPKNRQLRQTQMLMTKIHAEQVQKLRLV
ncbi:MAG: hypothetical protein EA249_00930 [Alkalibacterium sp.]|nr:MAG: hypothetical protein EA249_00930 [Alkalibacterium sp.]